MYISALAPWAFVSSGRGNRNEGRTVEELLTPGETATETFELSLFWNRKAGCQVEVIITGQAVVVQVMECHSVIPGLYGRPGFRSLVKLNMLGW